MSGSKYEEDISILQKLWQIQKTEIMSHPQIWNPIFISQY